MRYLVVLTLLFSISCKTAKVAPEDAVKKLGKNPYLELDGKPINMSQIGNVNAMDIASVTNYDRRDAIKEFGIKAKDGAVKMYTKKYATDKYEAFFKSVSDDYKKIFQETKREEIQYILNDRILAADFEGALFLINRKLFKSLKIVDQKTLVEKFRISDKKVGIAIKSKAPKNLLNPKKNF